MARDLTDLERRCLAMARSNRVAKKLAPLKYYVQFEDIRLRHGWEPGSPRWRSWARAVAALGCLHDGHVWRAGDRGSFARWRAAAIDAASAEGADRVALDALGPKRLAVRLAARSPILGTEVLRRRFLLPVSPPFATKAEAERAAGGMRAMGVQASVRLQEAPPGTAAVYAAEDLYGWEVLASEFGMDEHRRRASRRRGRQFARYGLVFDVGDAIRARFDAAKGAVLRAFRALDRFGMARVAYAEDMPSIRLTDAGMGEAESPGAGRLMERLAGRAVIPPVLDDPSPCLRPDELPRRAAPPIPRPISDPGRLAVLVPCMDHHGIGDPLTEWPKNLISRWAVVDAGGGIGRLAPPGPAPDRDELELSRRLADEAAGLMAGVAVGMGSAGHDEFAPFFIAARVGATPPARIDAGLIRARFGGTIFPPAVIVVEPVAEAGRWWSEATDDGATGGDDLASWRAMVAWFRGEPTFVAAAFVMIGDGTLTDLCGDEMPPESERAGSSWPRLVLGLTRRGSLAGIFGVTVHA